MKDMRAERFLHLRIAELRGVTLPILGCGFVGGYKERRSQHQNYAETSRLDHRALRGLDFEWTQNGLWMCVAVGLPSAHKQVQMGIEDVVRYGHDKYGVCNKLLFFEISDSRAPAIAAPVETHEAYVRELSLTQSVSLPFFKNNRSNCGSVVCNMNT